MFIIGGFIGLCCLSGSITNTVSINKELRVEERTFSLNLGPIKLFSYRYKKN